MTSSEGRDKVRPLFCEGRKCTNAIIIHLHRSPLEEKRKVNTTSDMYFAPYMSMMMTKTYKLDPPPFAIRAWPSQYGFTFSSGFANATTAG